MKIQHTENGKEFIHTTIRVKGEAARVLADYSKGASITDVVERALICLHKHSLLIELACKVLSSGSGKPITHEMESIASQVRSCVKTCPVMKASL